MEPGDERGSRPGSLEPSPAHEDGEASPCLGGASPSFEPSFGCPPREERCAHAHPAAPRPVNHDGNPDDNDELAGNNDEPVNGRERVDNAGEGSVNDNDLADENDDPADEAALAESDSETEAADHGHPAPTDQGPDAGRSLSRPGSPGEHADSPPAKRQHDGPADDQRRAKRRRTRRKRLRLQEKELKRQARLGRKRKRGHGLAAVGELGLPTPTEGTFPAALVDDDADAAVRDDFRTDWQLPDAGPQGLLSSPPRLPDPMDDSSDPEEVAAREEAMREKQQAKEKAKREREAARLEREKAKEETRLEKQQAREKAAREREEARLEKQRAKDEARLERQQARGGAQGAKQQAKQQAKQEAREEARREKQQAREEALRQRQTGRRENRAAPGRPRTKRQRPTSAPSPQPRGLLSLPAEVRLNIYRELLVAERPILVHSGWRAVYKRNRMRAHDWREGQKVCLPTAILRTSRLVYREAAGVLYGDNRFHYRLRDPSPAVVDVSRLADDGAGDADESASDWEQGNAPPTRSRRRPGKAEAGIDVDKHRGLFRRIVVEAEHNRFSTTTMKAMAHAIRVFAAPKAPASAADASPRPESNIRTLTVRVAPLCHPFAAPGAAGGPGFTFVDFFAPGSPVLDAMQDVHCQFLRVDLMTRYMDGASAEAGGSLTIDRRHEIVSRSGDGFWARDPVIQEQRQAEVDAAVRAMKNLGQSVADFCNAYVSGFAGGPDAMQLAWEEFEDVEEDS